MQRSLLSFLTEYETPKIVSIHSLTLAILLRVIQIIILLYSILYLLLYEQGYQKKDTAIISSVTLKVKGIGYIHTPENQNLVIDVADYIIPPSENNAIFIKTNYYQTDQTRSTCPESASLKEAMCHDDEKCQHQGLLHNMNGRWTGRCLTSSKVYSSRNRTANGTERAIGLCEMEGWCPAEHDLSPPMLIRDVLNFTIFIKNFIEFPAFSVKHKNMVDNLKPCIHHPVQHKDCPIFSIDYIINEAEKDQRERELMLRYGGVISVKLNWNCNLDRHLQFCKPVYSFARLDVPFRERPFSIGFNFRFASHWKADQIDHRTLTKAYGLRLIIAVSGKAGKFDFITLSLNTGSLVGIFGLATFLCDIILLHLSKEARLYRAHVFESVHLRTRMDSVMQNPHEIRRAAKEKSLSKSDSNGPTNESSSLYDTPQSSRKQRLKTSAARLPTDDAGLMIDSTPV